MSREAVRTVCRDEGMETPWGGWTATLACHTLSATAIVITRVLFLGAGLARTNAYADGDHQRVMYIWVNDDLSSSAADLPVCLWHGAPGMAMCCSAAVSPRQVDPFQGAIATF